MPKILKVEFAPLVKWMKKVLDNLCMEAILRFTLVAASW